MEEALNLEEGVHIKVKALANEEGVTKFRGGRYFGVVKAKFGGAPTLGPRFYSSKDLRVDLWSNT